MGAIFMPTNNNEIQKHQPQIKVSIDRLTVVGDFPTDLFMDHYYKWQRKHDFVRESGQGLQVVDTTQYVNTGEDVPQEQVAYMEIPRFQKDKLRLDFNPNHGLQTPGGQWLLDLIARIENKHYSRGDFAFDIFNEPRAKLYRLWKFGVSQSVFMGRKREMQTIYYGSPKSGQQIRQYNKLVEQKTKGKELVDIDSWWRIELQLRTGKVDDYPRLVKEMLADFYIPEYQKLESLSEQNMVYRLMNEPGFWGELADRTRGKYRKIFKEVSHENYLAIAMATEFIREFDRLENELQSIMNRFNIQADEGY